MGFFDIPVFEFNPFIIGLFIFIFICIIITTLRFPAMVPAFMLIGVQALGIVVMSMGIYIPHLVIYFISFLAVLALIVNLVFHRSKPLGLDVASISILVLMFILVFGYTLVPDTIHQISFQKIQMFSVLGLLPFMLGRTFALDDKFAWRTISFAAWFGVLFSPFVAGIVLMGGYKTLGAGRFSGMGDPIGAGTIFGMAAIFMVAASCREGTALWKRIVFISGTFAAMIVTFATYSRGPFLALFLGLLTMFLAGRKLQTKIMLAIIMPVILLLIFALLAPEAAWERIVGRTISNEGVSSLSTGRFDIYKETINKIPESLLLGHGTASYALVQGVFDKIEYPHNIFLEILYENGLIGLILFLIFLSAVLRGMIRFLKNDFLSKSLRRAYIGLFVHSIIIFQFSSHFAERPAFWLVCGLISGPFLFNFNETLDTLHENDSLNGHEQSLRWY